jgi:hypothetical protein
MLQHTDDLQVGDLGDRTDEKYMGVPSISPIEARDNTMRILPSAWPGGGQLNYNLVF